MEELDKIKKEIKIPVQGGLNPNILLSDKETIKKEALNRLVNILLKIDTI